MTSPLLSFAKIFSSAEPYYCGDGCFMHLLKDSDKNTYLSLISSLQARDFEILQQTETDGNLFTLLKGEFTVTLLFCPSENSIRMTFSENAPLPLLSTPETENSIPTFFYAFENDHAIIDCGMCLLIQCSDYSFFIVDSGHYFQFNDNDRIYAFMRKRTPENRKIVVNGWLITHAHTDHISKLIDFLKYNTTDVIIEGFYQNILPLEYDNDFGNHEEKEIAEKLINILEKYPAPVYKLHTGMKFYVRNLCFSVLYTHEDAHPEHIEDFNDSSVVLMLESENSKVFIPGDAAVLASKCLESRYSDALKADVVQIAHHGHTGLTSNCYELISADTAIFPVTRIMFEQDIDRMAANKKACEIASQYFITGDGTVCVALPYKKESVYSLPDETTEDFAKIERIWKYKYSEEYMNYIRDTYIKNGGKEAELLIPSSKFGFIEPK